MATLNHARVQGEWKPLTIQVAHAVNLRKIRDTDFKENKLTFVDIFMGNTVSEQKERKLLLTVPS